MMAPLEAIKRNEKEEETASMITALQQWHFLLPLIAGKTQLTLKQMI